MTLCYRYPKEHHIYKIEELPLSWEHKLTKSTHPNYTKNITGRNLISYVFKPISPNIIKFHGDQVHLSNNKVEIGSEQTIKEHKSKTKSLQSKITCNKNTQTDYRDSETQTDPWIPPCTIANDCGLSGKISAKPTANKTSAIDNISELDDRHEVKNLRQKLLSIDKRNLHMQIAIIKQIERIEWLAKEKKIDYVNEARMELAHSTLYQHIIEMKIRIAKREECYKRIQDGLKNQKLHSLFHNKKRRIRTLENVHCKKLATYIEKLTL